MSDDREITAPLELRQLQEGWAARRDARPRLHAIVRMAAKTDLGRLRENNEDKFESLAPEDPGTLALRGRVYAVADGMGGHAAGQIAAEVALNTFIRAYYTDTQESIEAALLTGVRVANGYLVEIARTIPSRSGMGTTLTAAVIREDECYVVHVGDSRLYLLRGGTLQQLTEDHSWVAEQVRRGNLTEAEAEQSPFRNVITRSLGAAPEVEPDLFAVQLEPGDRLLLCSDGLSGMVPREEIEILLAAESPSVAAWNLVQRANDCGGRDNITAMVVDILAIVPWEAIEAAGPLGPGAAQLGNDSRHARITQLFGRSGE